MRNVEHHNLIQLQFSRKIQLCFKWGFLFTGAKPIKLTIKDAKIDMPMQLGNKFNDKSEKGIEYIFKLAEIINTELQIENLEFNGHLINYGIIKPKISKAYI